MSYYATWNYLRLLITQSQYVDMVRSGHWMWVYDNLNIHQRVRHEHSGERNNKRMIAYLWTVQSQLLPVMYTNTYNYYMHVCHIYTYLYEWIVHTCMCTHIISSPVYM